MNNCFSVFTFITWFRFKFCIKWPFASFEFITILLLGTIIFFFFDLFIVQKNLFPPQNVSVRANKWRSLYFHYYFFSSSLLFCLVPVSFCTLLARKVFILFDFPLKRQLIARKGKRQTIIMDKKKIIIERVSIFFL